MLPNELLEPDEIAVEAEPGDAADARVPDDRDAAEGLPAVDVRDVDLHRGELREEEGVEERVAVVRVGAGVDDDAGGVVHRLVDRAAERALAPALEEARLDAELALKCETVGDTFLLAGENDGKKLFKVSLTYAPES